MKGEGRGEEGAVEGGVQEKGGTRCLDASKGCLVNFEC